MKVYNNRACNEYRDRLKSIFQFENLKKQAITLPKKKVVEGKEFEKFIRIDILSNTASTLLDSGKLNRSFNVYDQFVELLNNNKRLLDEGIFTKVRLLLQYPLSTAAYTRIQAEIDNVRSTIKEPRFIRKFQLTEQLDQNAFDSAFSVFLQKTNLRNLQELVDDLHKEQGWLNNNNPSSITVKFTPLNVSSYMLVVNDNLFMTHIYWLKKVRKIKNLLYEHL